MKLLNLDSLAEEAKRTVTLFGETYAIAEQTVGMMVEAIEATNRAKKAGAGSNEENFLEMVRFAKTLLPDCPDETIRRMSLKQLVALIEFASASDEKIATEAEAQQAADSDDEEDSEGKPES